MINHVSSYRDLEREPGTFQEVVERAYAMAMAHGAWLALSDEQAPGMGNGRWPCVELVATVGETLKVLCSAQGKTIEDAFRLLVPKFRKELEKVLEAGRRP